MARQRLRRQRDFRRPRHEGATFHYPGFVCRFLESDVSIDRPRLGVIASKRTGKAHDRNRAKRLLREAFRHLQARIPAGCDVILVARAGLPEMCSLVVRSDLESAIDRYLERLNRAVEPWTESLRVDQDSVILGKDD